MSFHFKRILVHVFKKNLCNCEKNRGTLFWFMVIITFFYQWLHALWNILLFNLSFLLIPSPVSPLMKSDYQSCWLLNLIKVQHVLLLQAASVMLIFSCLYCVLDFWFILKLRYFLVSGSSVWFSFPTLIVSTCPQLPCVYICCACPCVLSHESENQRLPFQRSCLVCASPDLCYFLMFFSEEYSSHLLSKGDLFFFF